MSKKVYTKEQIQKKRQQASSALHRVQAAGNSDRSTRPTGSPLSSAVQKTAKQGAKAAGKGHEKLTLASNKISYHGIYKPIMGAARGVQKGWGIIKSPNHRYNK